MNKYIIIIIIIIIIIVLIQKLILDCDLSSACLFLT